MSLLEQDLRASRIRLNLSQEPYLLDEGVRSIPDWLTKMVEAGNLELHWTENTGPYRKLLPTLRDCTDDDLIITCDDDIIYGKRWLLKLLEHANRHPEALVCAHARLPIHNVFGGLQSYMHWPRVSVTDEKKMLVPLGGTGTVYRRQLLDLAFLTWTEFLQVAPKQDDLWFRMASLRADTPVRIAPDAYSEVHPIKELASLSDTNLSTGEANGWQHFGLNAIQRAAFRLKAYLGIPVCENDRVWRAVRAASARFDRNASNQ